MADGIRAVDQEFEALRSLVGEIGRKSAAAGAGLQSARAGLADRAAAIRAGVQVSQNHLAGIVQGAGPLGNRLEGRRQELGQDLSAAGAEVVARGEALSTAAAQATEAARRLGQGMAEAGGRSRQGAEAVAQGRDALANTAGPIRAGLDDLRLKGAQELAGGALRVRAAGDSAQAAAELGAQALETLCQGLDAHRSRLPEHAGPLSSALRGEMVARAEGTAREAEAAARQASETFREAAVERGRALGRNLSGAHQEVESAARADLPSRVSGVMGREAEPQVQAAVEATTQSRQAAGKAVTIALEVATMLPGVEALMEHSRQNSQGVDLPVPGGVPLPDSINKRPDTFGDRIIKTVFAESSQGLDSNYAFFRPPEGEEHLWKRYGDGRWVKVEEGDASGGSGFEQEDRSRRHTPEEVVRMIREKGYQDLDPDSVLFRPPEKEEHQWRRLGDGRWERVEGVPAPPAPEPEPEAAPAPRPEDCVRMIREKGYQDLDPGYALYRPAEKPAEAASEPPAPAAPPSPHEIVRMIREQGYQDVDPRYALFRPPQGQEAQWSRLGDGTWSRVETPPPPPGQEVAGSEEVSAGSPPAPSLSTAGAVEVVKSIREKGYQDLDPAYALFQPPDAERDQWQRSADGTWRRVAGAGDRRGS